LGLPLWQPQQRLPAAILNLRFWRHRQPPVMAGGEAATLSPTAAAAIVSATSRQ
jgi:hypothetical protein